MKFLSALALPALLSLAIPAAAVTLGVGFTALPGTTLAARPELAGLVLEDRFVPYSKEYASGHFFNGQIQEQVVRSFLDGSLIFAWRIRPAVPGELPLIGFRIGGFGHFSTDGDWRSDSEGTVARYPHCESTTALSAGSLLGQVLRPRTRLSRSS